MTLAENDRETLIKYRIEKAESTIKDVEFLIKNDKFEISVTRIYYGIFYILSALALKYNFNTSKHQQLIGWFNQTFVKEGVLDKKYGRIVHKAYDKRSKSDYGDFVEFSRDEVEELFNEMKEFIERIKGLIFVVAD